MLVPYLGLGHGNGTECGTAINCIELLWDSPLDFPLDIITCIFILYTMMPSRTTVLPATSIIVCLIFIYLFTIHMLCC